MDEAKGLEASGTNFNVSTTQEDPLSQLRSINERKLGLTHHQRHASSYFKICALVRHLRSHLIQVLQTPDFQNCKAADELRKQMKLLRDLYKEMTIGINPLETVLSGFQPLAVENVLGKESWDMHKDGKSSQHKQLSERSSEERPPNSQVQQDDGHIRGSYIVGGSVFGGNFITFSGSDPVYCGLTKESYRCSLKASGPCHLK